MAKGSGDGKAAVRAETISELAKNYGHFPKLVLPLASCYLILLRYQLSIILTPRWSLSLCPRGHRIEPARSSSSVSEMSCAKWPLQPCALVAQE